MDAVRGAVLPVLCGLEVIPVTAMKTVMLLMNAAKISQI